MDRWQQLHDTVSRLLRDQRIGHPRALRLTVHVRGDENVRLSLRQRIASAASEWFGGDAQTVRSAENNGAAADLLVWPTGSTALISVSSGDHGRFGGSLTLMGTQGSLYHDIDGTDL